MLGCTVSELLERSSSRELSEWMAYDMVEGLPDRRRETLLATLLAATVNAHRDPARGKAARPLDFLPWLAPEEDEEAVGQEAMLARIELLNAAFGGQDLRAEER